MFCVRVGYFMGIYMNLWNDQWTLAEEWDNRPSVAGIVHGGKRGQWRTVLWSFPRIMPFALTSSWNITDKWWYGIFSCIFKKEWLRCDVTDD